MCEQEPHTEPEVSRWFLHPEQSMGVGHERERLKAYIESIQAENDISEIWRWYSKDFFSYDFNAYIEAVDKFLPRHMDEFVQLCDRLNVPFILSDIFRYCDKEYGEESVLDFLRKAPKCTEVSENGIETWNRHSFLALMIMEYSFHRLSMKYPIGHEIDEDEVKNFLSKFSSVLSKRKDACFLVWNYVRYLISYNERNRNILMLYIAEIGSKCAPIFDELYNGKNWFKALRPKGVQIRETKDRFLSTGLLDNHAKDSMYMNLVTQMQFYHDEHFEQYISFFEESLMFHDENFKAFEERPLLCHYYIADIYLATEAPKKVWMTTWKKLRSARYRVCFRPYDAESNAVERNINFFLLVGIAMMEQLYSEDEKDKKAGIGLSKLLYRLVYELIIHRGKRSSMLHGKMLKYITVWRFMYLRKIEDEASAMNRMTEFIVKQNWKPRFILEIILMLKANQFVPWGKLIEKNEVALRQKLEWAVQYAKNLEPCERRLGDLAREVKKYIQ